jgi:photosystem I subunit 8
VVTKRVPNRSDKIIKKVIMAAYYLPSILVPLVGLVFPALTMASLFLYIEREDVS